MFKTIYIVVRILYYPFFNWFMGLFSQKIKKRILFEKENDFPQYRSFKKDNRVADLAFEISSEGELEQIRPLIQEAISKSLKVELIYCSESVDHKCQQIYNESNNLVRLFRLPLLTYCPFITQRAPDQWLTAKKFFLCRYDFFPELLLYGRKNDVEFILLWATLKNTSTSWIHKQYRKFVFGSFNKIVAATKFDQDQIIERFHLPKDQVECYDFRPWQILNRQNNALKTLNENFPFFEKFNSFIQKFSKEKRIIFGSFWDNELMAFGEKAKDLISSGYLISIVCHKLDDQNIEKISKELEFTYKLKTYSVNSDIVHEEVSSLYKDFEDQPGVLLINLKGVLCELYTLFGTSFVGGGHTVSVHSLMEPFLANNIVFCGPKVHRSTEYDLILESHPDRVHIVEKLFELFPLITQYESLKYSNIDNFSSYYQNHFDHLLNWLEIRE